MLNSTGSHPTAAWLYEELRGEFTNLSMGTVYRNLNILVEQGLTKKIDFGSTFDRFDGNLTEHYHFVCNSCHSITDLKLPINEALNGLVEKETSFQAMSHQIQFYGLCNECRAKE